MEGYVVFFGFVGLIVCIVIPLRMVKTNEIIALSSKKASQKKAVKKNDLDSNLKCITNSSRRRG